MREVQHRVLEWVIKAFGTPFLMKKERALRILEEAIELAQSHGVTREEALRVTELTYSRPVGNPLTELGDLVFCAAALAQVEDVSLIELCWTTYYKNDDPERIALIRMKCRTTEKIRGSEELAQLCREF